MKLLPWMLSVASLIWWFLCSDGVMAGRPNILFFLVDDLGVTDTSVSFLLDERGELIRTPMNERYRTPNVRRLAEQGMRFTNAFAYTVCTPTRVSLISGVEAPRLHITTWTHPQRAVDTGEVNEGGLQGPTWRVEGLGADTITLPKILGASGYQTIHCGKAHFAPNDRAAGDPVNLGFDINIAGHGAGGPGSHLGAHDFSAEWRGGGRDWDVPALEAYHGRDVFLTDALTRQLKDALSKCVKEKRPFFAYMSHYAVHAPFEVDARFAANYPSLRGKELAFATMIEGVDQSLGELLDHLESLGVAEETLVVFYSDNGSDGPPNRPLSGIKGSRFMGGNRVPLIAAWAKRDSENPMQKSCPIPAGSLEDDLVTPVDFLPTLTKIAGASPPEGLQMDGYDLTPYFKGIPGTHRPQQFLVHFPHGRHRSHLFTSWTDGDWKVTYEYAKRAWHLHNLHFDLGETENLVDLDPELALAMAKRLVRELDDRGAQYPVDLATGKPVRPHLAPLERADEKSKGRRKQPSLPEDDLDLSLMIRKVGEENFYREDGWYTWCSSIIKGEDGKYNLFYVRWPKEHGFYAWLTHSEVARAVSNRPAGPYRFKEVVIGSRGQHRWNAINAHNVKAKKFGDKFYLYFIAQSDGGRGLSEQALIDTALAGYSASYWRPLRCNQRAGVAVADSLDGPWTVHPTPIVEPHGVISTVAVNPAVWRSEDGKYHLIVKGDHPRDRVEQAHGISDSPLGPFHLLQAQAFTGYSEDVSVWRDSKRGLTYGVLHDGKGYGLIVSKDGYEWRRARHFRVTDKVLETTHGAPLTPARLERPFVFYEDGAPRVLSGGVQNDRNGDSCIVLIPLGD